MRLSKVLRVGAWGLAGVVLQAGAVAAATAPKIGPPAAWVLPAPALAPEADALKSLPVAILLNDTQLSFDADGWTEYREIVGKVQAADGLQAVGAVPFVWSPWSDTLTFHHASIIRDGQTIDVLPKDGVFSVMRRETGLEQALITGELTALLQPDGLQVGDVLDVAISIRHADPLLKGRAGVLFANWDQSPVGQLRLAARWPSTLPMRWKASAGLPPLRRTDAGGVTTVGLELQDIHPPILPAHAPVRFLHGREIEFSDYADWREVAQVMAPLFAKAAELAPQSPVAAQAALIAKSSDDPKVRAAAALQLVQGQVRYLAHMEDGGGYAPQSADDTWRLRSGDCKAKTALLLALLHELGIPAQAVLANTVGGDGLDAHLPSHQLFDHALVRVTIGGRDYWLDGTRLGDRALDDLDIPAYGWVLPLDATEARLTRLVPAPAAHPQVVQVIRYDASAGVTAPEPTHLETILHGDPAVVVHAQLSQVPPERLDATLKAFWASQHSAFTAEHVAASWDPATREEKVTADGKSKLDWSGQGLDLMNVRLGGAPDLKRDPAASDPDAPYVVDFPMWSQVEESVVLPPGATMTPAQVKAFDVDRTIAGVAYHRSGALTGAVFTVVASARSLQPEITAAAARASVDPLTRLGEEAVYAPAGRQSQAANDAAALNSHPTTVDGHLDRGNALIDAGRYREAVRELDAAIALDPRSQLAWADRAIAHAWLGDPEAATDADKADALGAPEIVAARSRGILAARKGDKPAAIAAYRHALTLAPDDEFTLGRLIDLETASGDYDGARKDLDHLVASHSERAPTAHLTRALIEAAAHRKDAAERELAGAPADTAEARLDRALVYRQIGDDDLALADIDASIRLRPTVGAWLVRAGIDGLGSAACEADVVAALKLAPDDEEANVMQANSASARGDFAAAITEIDRLVGEHPEGQVRLSLMRARAEHQLGRTAEVEADLAKAKAATGDDAPDAGTLCEVEVKVAWRPQEALADCEAAARARPDREFPRVAQVLLLHRLGRPVQEDKALADASAAIRDPVGLNNFCYDLAVENLHLDRALAACDASLKLDPTNVPALDSRGFVLLRLGRDAEAIIAYDAAVARAPREYHSLYGRALAEARLGQASASARDLAAALAIQPYVRKEFEAMGVRAPGDMAVAAPPSK